LQHIACESHNQDADIMDKRLVREFRERCKAVAAIEAEEQRTASVEVRWQQLNSILRLAIGLGLTHTGSADEDIVYQRWARLKGSRV
jgi:hypothetical protein